MKILKPIIFTFALLTSTCSFATSGGKQVPPASPTIIDVVISIFSSGDESKEP